MDGGRFHTLHSCTTKAVCAASNKRATTAKGAVGQDLDVTHALGLALAAGPSAGPRWKAACPILVDGQCIGGVGVSGGDWETDLRIAQAASSRSARAGNNQRPNARPGLTEAGCVGTPWIKARSRRLHRHGLVVGRAGRRHQALGQARDRRLLHALGGQARGVRQEIRLPGRRKATRRAGRSRDRGDRQHHAERRASARPRGRRRRPASTSSSTSRSPTTSPKAAPSPRSAARPAWCSALGYQRRRESHFRWIKQQIDAGVFGRLVNAEANISRDRLGKIDLAPGATRPPACRAA